MRQDDISVVIPVYKVGEPLLRRCIDSVLCQHLSGPRVRVILVIDGKEENKTLLESDLVNDYDAVEWRTVPHGGVAAARNAGIAAAKGDFVVFVDADDYLPPNALQALWDGLVRSCASFVMANHSRAYAARTEPVTLFHSQIAWSQGDKSEVIRILLSSGTDAATVWGKMFRADFLNAHQLRFKTNLRNGEDQEFMVRCAQQAAKIAAIPDDVYTYVYNSGSSVRAFNRNYAKDVEVTIRAIGDDLGISDLGNGYTPAFRDYCLDRLLLIIVNYVFSPTSDFSPKQRKNAFFEIREHRPFREALKESDFSGFSPARRLVLKLIESGAYERVKAIVGLRHWQLRMGR